MIFEDFTTYTEVDAVGNITVTPSKIDYDDLGRNEESYVYKDKGVNHFSGDFELLFETQLKSSPAPDESSLAYIVGIANSVDDFNAHSDLQTIYMQPVGAGSVAYTLQVREDDSDTNDLAGNEPRNVTNYITFNRDDDGGANSTGRLTAYIRSGSHEGTLEDTLTVDCGVGQQNDFRYIYGLSTHNSGHDLHVSGFTQNLDLQEEEDFPQPPSRKGLLLGVHQPSILVE